MQYAILCYHDEKVTCAWSKEQDDAVMVKLGGVMDKLSRQGKLGPVARLLPTTAATTLRKDREQPIVIDGPFAETKESSSASISSTASRSMRCSRSRASLGRPIRGVPMRSGLSACSFRERLRRE